METKVAEVGKQATLLVVSVYANKVDIFEGYDLVKRRVYTLLKVLPPTENAYEQHLKRAALATAIDMSSHIYKPNAEPCEDYTGGQMIMDI